MINPILIDVTRGGLVESTHRGALVLVSSRGETVLALGDGSRPVFARSAVKALQCLPLIETGAADRFGFGSAEIALACASHTGTARHTALASAMLAAVGLTETALGCGAHMPLGERAAKDLLRSGGRPTVLHNNCSGKHAGMLATAVHLGESQEGYWETTHPVQERIRTLLVEITGAVLSADLCGMDGCSVPTWAQPLSALALAFARFGCGETLAAKRREAARRILAACWGEPELVAGPGRADTLVMARLPGQVFLKTGAEGVYCGAFPKLKLGFALKIDDGATRASVGLAIALVTAFYPEAEGLFDRQSLKNWHGYEVGRIELSAMAREAIARCRPQRDNGSWSKIMRGV